MSPKPAASVLTLAALLLAGAGNVLACGELFRGEMVASEREMGATAVGETKTCTFTNAQAGSIKIVKDATPNDEQDFAFTGNITNCTSFTLDDDENATGANTTNSNEKLCPVGAGTYNVDETVPSNWVKENAICSDGSPITAIDVSAGENVTCTFTNTKKGSIKIVKDAVPNDLQDFVFTGDVTNCTSFTLDDDAGVTGGDDAKLNEKTCAVVPGTYAVDETPVSSWVKGATCSDGSPRSIRRSRPSSVDSCVC